MRQELKSYPLDDPERLPAARLLSDRIQNLELRQRQAEEAAAIREAEAEKKQAELDCKVAAQMIAERRAKIDALCQQPMTAEYRKWLLDKCRKGVEEVRNVSMSCNGNRDAASGARVGPVALALAGFYDSMVRRLDLFTRKDFENWRKFDGAFYNDAIRNLGFRTAEERSLICEAARQFRNNQNPPMPTDDIPAIPALTSRKGGPIASMTYSQVMQQQWELVRAGKQSDDFYDRSVYVLQYDAEGNSLWDASGKYPLEGLKHEETWMLGNGEPAREHLFKKGPHWYLHPKPKELPWSGEYNVVEMAEEKEKEKQEGKREWCLFETERIDPANVLFTREQVEQRAQSDQRVREAKAYIIRVLERYPGSMWQKNVNSREWEWVQEIASELRRAADIMEPAKRVMFYSCAPKPNDGKPYKFWNRYWLVDDTINADTNPPMLADMPRNGNGTHESGNGTPKADMTVPVNQGKEFARAIKDYLLKIQEGE